MNSVKNELPVANGNALRNEIRAVEDLGYDFQVESIGTSLVEQMFALTKELFEERRVSDGMLNEYTKECIATEMANVIIGLTKLTIVFNNRDDVQNIIDSKMGMK